MALSVPYIYGGVNQFSAFSMPIPKKILPSFSLEFIGVSSFPFHSAREQNGKFGLIDSRGVNSAYSYQPSAVSC